MSNLLNFKWLKWLIDKLKGFLGINKKQQNFVNGNQALLEVLRKASDGLLYMSEYDYPFEAFLWDNDEPIINNQTILQKTGNSLNTPVEVISLEEFFETAIQEQDWHDEEDKETVHRFQALVETLRNNLSDLKVYRLGTIDIDVYLVGKISEDSYAGLSTKVVET